MQKIKVVSFEAVPKRHSIRYNFDSDFISTIYISKEAFGRNWPRQISVTVECEEGGVDE